MAAEVQRHKLDLRAPTDAFELPYTGVRFRHREITFKASLTHHEQAKTRENDYGSNCGLEYLCVKGID